MRKFKLVTQDNKSIYEGFHHNLIQTIEYALSMNIQMDGVDLSDADLQHINLDGLKVARANFKGANLSGANMSEAEFTECDFSDADLSNACLCYSNLSKCNFKYTCFSGTDIAMSSIVLCHFQGFLTLQMDYDKAFKLESLTFKHFENVTYFSTPPTIIKQGKRIAAIFDKVIFYNDMPHTFEYKDTSKSILKFLNPKIQSMVDSK